MQDLFTLYQYIKNKYNNYKTIEYTEKELIVVFYEEFIMKIQLKGFYRIYFNDIFYYEVDWQDIKDTIDDFLLHQYAFCEQNKKLKIISLKDFHMNVNYNHVWTIEKTLK